MKTVNLGVLAHIDAGKTSLSERLLYEGGAIGSVGSVDEGSTQTDSMDLERRRGITIKTSVASFVVDGVSVNLIDTPGHPDFIAEVERALRVLDGAVLVVSAVEGVQAQTLVLMRALRRLRVPTLVFVNKIDRRGARDTELVAEIERRLSAAPVVMSRVSGLGQPGADASPVDPTRPDVAVGLTETLAQGSDAFLAAWVHEGPPPPDRLRHELRRQVANGSVNPVFFGSAVTGAGVRDLLGGIAELLPAADHALDDPASGLVFKIERSASGEKIAYARMYAGALQLRHRITRDDGTKDKVTGIDVVRAGAWDPTDALVAGQIGRLWGLKGARIGDVIGTPPAFAADAHFSPPALEAVVLPRDGQAVGRLHAALSQLAEEDPLIGLRTDAGPDRIAVSLYGEVQKDVIRSVLAEQFDLDVEFSETTTICVERPVASGDAAEVMKDGDNPFYATVGLRVDPAEPGQGVVFALEVELGSLPLAFVRAIEESVRSSLRQGLHGWEVTDVRVTLTHSGYDSVGSTAADFRDLTPLVLQQALHRAGTTVLEPVNHFTLEVPSDALGPVLARLAQLGAVPGAPTVDESVTTLEGQVPAAHVQPLLDTLQSLTRGEGLLETRFDTYRRVRGTQPTRPRTGVDPLNRREYLLHCAGILTARRS